MPLPPFRISGGSVTGRRHLSSGKPNQDAFAWEVGARSIVAVVCDGCGSGQHSGVGAQLFAQFIVNRLSRIVTSASSQASTLQPHPTTPGQPFQPSNADLDSARAAVQEDLAILRRGYLLPEIERLAGAMCPVSMRPRDIIDEYFLFTVVGAMITPIWTSIFYLGDGLFTINDRCCSIAPDGDNNAPTYVAYGLGGSSLPPNKLCFQLAWLGATDTVDNLMLATDGVADIEQAYLNGALRPDGKPVGHLGQFLEPDCFANSDLIRRKLFLMNNPRPNSALPILHDDTTIVGIRRHSTP